MTALIVDDEKEICFLLKYQLHKLGIESVLAHNLTDGLEKFSPAEHDMVFLDINLPDGNGLDAIPLLKKKKKDVNVIVISAYNTESEQNRASDLGADVFLGKPFNKLMITQLINNIKFNK
ncbi:MAG TPA: response regulator [Fulvivirga sp.]|nr:response regulator [Fulvivirga sp.]